MVQRPAAVRHQTPPAYAGGSPATVDIGVGIDTSRYGHYAAFLNGDLQQAAGELEVVESAVGYAKLLLDQLGLTPRLKGSGPQRRCACSIHRGDGRGRTFSVNLGEHLFQCFDTRCAAKGDVIDLWAKLHGHSVREAALELVQTFHLEPAPRPSSPHRPGHG